MSGDPDHGAAPAADPAERDLLQRLRRGDREGFEQLIDRHGEALMRYLVSILRSRDAAEEIFQDTWVRVAGRIRRFDPNRPFAPWLLRVARNLAYDHLRRRRRWSLFNLETRRDRGLPDHSPGSSDPTEQMVAKDLAARLLPRLEAGHREVLWLRFHQECSYEEIADVCRIPLGTVKSRLRRALDRLAELYERMEAQRR